MHDGRFANLDEVLQHYNQGFSVAPTTDPIMATRTKNRMSAQDLTDLKAFLLTLTDDDFHKNPSFLKPR
jgi:cytochrome c peroxidase